MFEKLSNNLHKLLSVRLCCIARNVLLLLVTVMPLSSLAQVDYYWRGDSADPGDGYSWNTANNWWRGFTQAPQGSENIIIDNNHKAGVVNTNNLSNTSRYRILFNAGASSSRTITGTTENTFFDYGGGIPRIVNSDTGLKTLAFPIRAGYNNFEINANGAGITIDRLDLQGNNVNIQGNGGHTLTVRGELRGSGSLTIQSNTIVVLSGTPTNTGTMTINAGQLRYAATAAAGHVNTINVGASSGSAAAQLFISAAGVTVSNSITVRSGSSGVKTIGHLSSGAATFTGAMTLQTSVTFSNGAGGSLTFSGPVDFNSGQRTLTVPSSQSVTISGAISGDSGNGVVKQGGGILRLAGNNSYTGSTTIDAGTMTVGSGGNLGSGSDIYIASGATVTAEVNVTVGSLREKASANSGAATIGSGSVITVNGANKGTFFMSTISGAGGLTVSASGTSTMRLFSANTYSGDTVINSGTLGLWDNGSIANSPRIVIGTNAVWDVSTRASALTLASGQGILVAASSSVSPARIHTASGTGSVATASNSALVFGSYSSGGGAPLTISGNGSLTLVAGNSVIVTNTGAALGVGNYKLISKGASSSVAGAAPGSVTVAGNGLASGASASLSITGGELFLDVISTEPDVRVLGNDVIINDGSTSPSSANHTEFGDALVVGGTVTRTYTITNNGASTLFLGNVYTNAGGNPAEFIVTAQPGSPSLAPGAITTFQVQFDPAAAGVRYADIEFTNNVSGTKNPYTFRVQGTGTYVEVAVSGNDVNIADGSGSPSLANHTDFGPVGSEGSTLSRTYTVTNTGNRAMVLGTVSISGTHATNFVVTSQPAATLNPSNSTTIVVLFDPSDVGLHSAALSFSTTDDSYGDGLTENPFDFNIQGTGVAPAITGAPASLAFSSVLGTAPAAQNFHVTNGALGTMEYTVASNVSWLGISPNSGSVGAGAGQTHTASPVVQAGQQVGTSNALITVSSATATNGPRTIGVSWTISAIPNPTGQSAVMDGQQMVRLAWNKDVGYNVMIIHKTGGTPATPTNGTVYALDYAFGDGSRVIAFNTSAAKLEHVVSPGSVNHYAFYSINNNFYSPGVGAGVTSITYRAGEIVDPGAYTNGTAISGLNSGSGWTGGWVTGGSGTWLAQTNYSAGGGADVPGLQSPVNYPAQTANRFTVSLSANQAATARKSFSSVNSGTLYVAGLVAYRYSGNNKYVGISFMNGSSETGFVGKAGGGSVLAIDSYGGTKVNGSTTLGATETLTGNVYLVVAKYDFSSKQIRANAYLWTATIPTSEPGSWDVTATVPGSGISSIDGIRISGGGFSGDNIGSLWFDEIRVAGSWAELLGLGAVAATNYVIGTTNQVLDGQVAAGTFPVTIALRSVDGVESVSTTPPFFIPNFDIFNPVGTQIVTDKTFSVFSYQDSGKTLIASNSTHAPAALANVVLGVHTARWSAVSSNGVQAVDISVLSNSTPIAFNVIDDDVIPPVLQSFRIFGASGNATVTVAEITGGSGWAITGLVQDAGSGINVNGNNTAQPDSSPYFELWDDAGVMQLRQAFNQIPFTNGGAIATLSSIISSNNTALASASLGVWTARVVTADADNDRLGDRLFITNELAFTITPGNSTAGLRVTPTLLNVTSTYGSVVGGAPWPNMTVSNVGTGILVYDVSISYNNGFGWLSVNPSNGTVNTAGSQIHTGLVSAASLNPGNYEAVIAFVGSQTNGTQYVTNRFTVIGFNAGEIVDPFTNAAGSVNGTTGGAGWTNAWNASAAYTFNSGNLSTPNNYPAPTGRKICGNSVGSQINAARSFPAFTTGKVFMAIAAQKSEGNSDGFYGISFMNGVSEAAFAGKLFNDGNFGLDLGSNGGSQSGGFGANGLSTYLFIGMYDFGNNTFNVRAYNSGDVLPLTEPTWGASKQPTTPLTRIDGVRLAAKDEGTVCFDEVRVASSWPGLLNQFTAKPTLHATSMTFTNLATDAMTVAWTPGNGLNRIVVAREGAAVTFSPTNGAAYAANNNFALAADLGGGNKIVYNASGSSVSLSGLNPETRYFFAVFEYNGAGVTANYYTNAGFLAGNRWTLSEEPAEQAVGLNAYTVSDTSISNTWTQAGGSPAASGYVVLRSYASVSNVPVDGVGYTNGQVVGTVTYSVVTPGTTEKLLHTGLASCSNFHFRIFSFRWNGSDAQTYNYFTNSAPSAAAETTCETPAIQASDIVFTQIGTNRIGLLWQNGNGQSRLVVARGTNAVNENPVDGSVYTAGSVFGSGSHLGNGNFVVFNGTGAAVEVSGLFPGSTYHFRVYEYNGTGSGIDYNQTTTNGNPNSAATASFGLVEDKFGYSAGNMFGYNGGTGWTNTWGTLDGLMEVVDGNFGAFGAYPSDTGTRQGYLNSTTKRSATRNFPARTSGQLFFAIKMNLGTSVQSGYFGVNLLNGAASGGAGNNSVTGYFGKASGVADNKLSLSHNGITRTNKLDGTNPGYQFNTGTGNDYLMVASYDFGTRTFKALAYTASNIAHAEPDREDAWIVVMTNVVIDRIDGIEIIGSGLGNCYFDHIRIGPSWEEVMWNLPDDWHEIYGPKPSLAYIGTNYNAGFYGQVITNLSDAELKSSGKIDFSVRWDSSSGIFLTNNTATITNIGSPNGRVNPNWDPLAIGAATNAFRLDRFFGNYFGRNGSLVVTTYQYAAFNITNIDFDLRYFVTVSAETDPGGTTVTAPNGGNPIPVTRAITINEPLRFYVFDDDTNAPLRGVGGMDVLVTNQSVGFQDDGNVNRYFISDGDLANYGMDVSIKAYDTYSGLQRATGGSSVTNMSLTITNLIVSNTSFYVSNRSTPTPATTNVASSNMWSFTNSEFDFSRISLMWGGDGTSLQGQDLPVYATTPDNDSDRVADQSLLQDQLFGYIRVIDDDFTGPVMTTARVTGIAIESWTNTPSIAMQWSQGVDDLSGVAQHRYVAPGEFALIPSNAVSGVGVGGTVTSAIVSVGGQGVLTGYVFAVDADNDRTNDVDMGNVVSVMVRIDTNPPPRVTSLIASDAASGFLVDASIDESSEIKVQWSGYDSAAEAAGWRNRDQQPLSSWDTYIVSYYESSDTNGTPAAGTVTTVLDRSVSGWSSLSAHTFTNLVISNLNFDAYYRISVQGRDAAGNVSLVTNVTGSTDRFVVTQGLAKVGLGTEVSWTGPIDEQVLRDYDVIYIDSSLGFRNSLSNQWQFMQYTNRPEVIDDGGIGRFIPGLLTNTTYRFYRVAKENRWQTSNNPRVGSIEVYVTKALALNPGENWYSMFSFPDPLTTNEIDSTVARVFGTNLLPRGVSQLFGTKISWFGTDVSGSKLGSVPTASVWLANSGWQWSTGGVGSANNKLVPRNQGFLIELPISASPTNLVLIGRLPTQSVVHAVSGFGASIANPIFHILSMAMPERLSFVNLGISTNNGFRGGVNIGQSDEIRILDNSSDATGLGGGSLKSPKVRIYWRTSDNTWRTSSGASANGYVIEPDDAVIIVRRHSTTIFWTNQPVFYTSPTKNFAP